MIVIEIIAIVAAIALPEFLRARVETNETAAVASIKTIISAEISYCSVRHVYATFDELASEALGHGTAYLEPSWHQGVVKNGYQYTIDEADDDSLLVTAVPVKPGKTGINTFHGDDSGKIWWEVAPSS